MTTETGSRAGFLAPLRRSLAGAPEPNHVRPVTPLVDGIVEPVAYAHAPEADGLVEAFIAAMTANGGVARTIDGDDQRAEFVDEAIASINTTRIVLTAEPECVGLGALLAERDGVEVVDFADAATVATCDLGITGARAGVALTGSIVVDAGRAGGRTVSLLPPVHVAFVRADALVATPGDLWRSLGSPMPSNLVQISGPSRSADIELVLTLGVHGPRALWIGVLL